MAQKQAVKFVKVPRESVCEISERENIQEADHLYIGESGTMKHQLILVIKYYIIII